MSLCRCVAIAGIAILLGACAGNEHLSFLNPQGPVARAEAVHFYVVLGIMAVFVAGPIFIGLPWIVWRYRYANKAARYTPKWRDSGVLTFLTWAGPVAIVIVLGYFVWRDAHRLNPYRPIASTQAPLQLQVIGYDWKWLVIYPDQGIATIGTMALPVGRPVLLHITSATVMQSFFIPALGSQIYAMGGMVTRLNLEATHAGRYLAENTMYNGSGFHDQKFTAVGMSPGDFKKWVGQVKYSGTPIDTQIFNAIAKRTTREQMAADLPGVVSHDGMFYLSHVSPRQFATVVRAVKAGTAPELISTSQMPGAMSNTAMQQPAAAAEKARP
ncbi:MAG: ubiquinol oxidase subunit II [Rhodanobacteraceae bacterium]